MVALNKINKQAAAASRSVYALQTTARFAHFRNWSSSKQKQQAATVRRMPKAAARNAHNKSDLHVINFFWLFGSAGFF